MNRLSLLVFSALSRSSLVRAPFGCHLIKKYSKQQGEEEMIIDKERAQSTAEVLNELSQEMEEKDSKVKEKEQQGFVSQTSDKMMDAATEVVGGDPNPEDVKEIYKEASPGDTYHKPRDDGGIGPTSI